MLDIIHHLKIYASAYGNTAKARMARIEKKFFILRPFKKLSIPTKKIIRFGCGIVKRFGLYYQSFNQSILNGHTTRAASQSSRGVQIVLLSKNFSRVVVGRRYCGRRVVFLRRGRVRVLRGHGLGIPLWEHRNFDGGHFMKG